MQLLLLLKESHLSMNSFACALRARPSPQMEVSLLHNSPFYLFFVRWENCLDVNDIVSIALIVTCIWGSASACTPKSQVYGSNLSLRVIA